MKRKIISGEELLKRFKQGERDFSNIQCKELDISDVNLSGIILKNADISYSCLSGVKFQDADLTGANLEWSNCNLADFNRAELEKANCSYSLFNNALFEKANLRDANFSWSLMCDINMQRADMRGANFFAVAFSMDEVTEEGLAHIRSMAGDLSENLPRETMLRIKFAIGRTTSKHDAVERAKNDDESEQHYGAGRKSKTQGVLYGHTKADTSEAYGTAEPYKTEQKYVSENPYGGEAKHKRPPQEKI